MYKFPFLVLAFISLITAHSKASYLLDAKVAFYKLSNSEVCIENDLHFTTTNDDFLIESSNDSYIAIQIDSSPIADDGFTLSAGCYQVDSVRYSPEFHGIDGSKFETYYSLFHADDGLKAARFVLIDQKNL